MMIRLLCASLALAFGGNLVSVAQAATPKPPFTVKIIGFNDFHGNLESPGTFGITAVDTVKPAVGGAPYVAGFVARLKAQNPLNVVVGAGDMIGASPLVSALFSDEPTVESLNRIGLEFTSVGNHEFDKGAVELQRLQNGGCKLNADGSLAGSSCKGASVGTPVPFEGAKYKWLSANVVSTATGKTLFPAYGIKSFNGVKVAFIGMTLKDTPTIVTPSGVAGLQFQDEADTVNALIPRLRAQGVESIVVLVHQGGFQSTPTVSDINGCDGDLAGSDIAKIVSRLDNAVDLVISGHTHTAYNCSANTVSTTVSNGVATRVPRASGLPNAAGRLVPVTQAAYYGRVLSDIDVTIDPNTRDITAVSATNRLVDRTDPTVTADATINNIVNAYKGLIAPIANVVIGSITADLTQTADKACNQSAGELIADAQLAATAPADFGGAQIAFMNRGGVRANFTYAGSSAGEGDGNVTFNEAYNVQPFGNSLVTMTITAQDLKNVLEQQFAGCRGQSATATRLMIPSAGFRYTFDGGKACDARISNVTLTAAGVTETIVDGNGAVLDPTKTYRVTVNNFMSTGGDGFTTFLNGKNLLGGAQDIDALAAYMADFKAPLPAYNPTDASLQKPRVTRVGGTTCPTGSNTNP
jgi:5'-nucleotidase